MGYAQRLLAFGHIPIDKVCPGYGVPLSVRVGHDIRAKTTQASVKTPEGDPVWLRLNKPSSKPIGIDFPGYASFDQTTVFLTRNLVDRRHNKDDDGGDRQHALHQTAQQRADDNPDACFR
jgi:hypothetical protein